jgi:hypothetical protein
VWGEISRMPMETATTIPSQLFVSADFSLALHCILPFFLVQPQLA